MAKENTISTTLNSLFKVKPDEEGHPYTNVYVAHRTGVTASYIGQLRAGKVENPGYKTLLALAQFFDVPVTVFFCQGMEEEYIEDLLDARRLKRSGLHRIAMRAVDLGVKEKQALETIIESMLQKGEVEG